MAYIGSAEDSRRIAKQNEEREKSRKEFEERKQKGEANVDGAGLRQFGAGSTDVLEAAFKNETIGLATREEFLSKKATLPDRLKEEEERKKREAERQAAAELEERKKKRARLDAKSKLSFQEEEEEEEEKDGDAADVSGDPQAGFHGLKAAQPASGLQKNPETDTSFLPDRERAQHEEGIRKQIEREYELQDQNLRAEPLEVTYSYFDGSGHRRVILVQRGDSIGNFLKKVREELSPEFKDLRNIAVSNLLYVKEDYIIPHGVTFHDLIRKKALGKPALYDFGAHDDVRAHSDSRIENTESHAGKVVSRSYYERNKHNFPASKWEHLGEF